MGRISECVALGSKAFGKGKNDTTTVYFFLRMVLVARRMSIIRAKTLGLGFVVELELVGFSSKSVHHI